MCGGDDHLAWKRPVSLEACRGLHTARGLQLRVHRDQYEFEYGRTVRLHLDALLDQIFIHSLDTPLWVRVEGRLVRKASIQEALASLRQEIGSQQSRPFIVQDETLHDSLPQPPPPPVPMVPQASPYVLHGHSEVAPPAVVPTTVTDDAHAPSLPAKFRMPDIERYTDIGCPCIHFRLYSTMMRAHGLDESQMITLFPLSLSGAAQRWRELEALRQRTDESVSSFISRWIARHVVGVPFTDFGEETLGGQRLVDVSAIGSSSQRPPRRYLPGIERPPVSYTATRQPCYVAQFTARPATPYPRPRAQQTSTPFALRTYRQFSQGLDTRPIDAPLEACRPGFDRPGFGILGQPSVTTNPLPTHTTHAVPSPIDGIHFLDFDEIDDHIHMLSEDDSDPEPIMPDVIYEMSGVNLGPRMPAPFRLVPEAASVQTATAPHDDDSQTLDVQYILRGGRVMRQPPPATARSVEGTSAPEEGQDYTSPEGFDSYDDGRQSHMHWLPSPIRPFGQWLGPERLFSSHRHCPRLRTIGFRARTIPSSLHQKVKFIHDGQVVMVRGADSGDREFVSRLCSHVFRLAQQHGGARYYVEHVLSSRYGLGRRQHGPSEFMAFLDHDVAFGLGFTLSRPIIVI
ncbi:hypothetical protein CK203_107117 [Vitis vinifera]|uniref:Uncharacterized protein n=1 Tax=Vitis vinifera TaxID=29760 RepID=A0A438DGX0_VITVI|nr:hypothetical protein CK203_107117 [Vitis vinifera]